MWPLRSSIVTFPETRPAGRPFHTLVLRRLRFRARRIARFPLFPGRPLAPRPLRQDGGTVAPAAPAVPAAPAAWSAGEPACAGTQFGPLPNGYSRSLRQTPSEPCS